MTHDHFAQGTPNKGPVPRESSTFMTDPEAEMVCRTFAEGLDAGLNFPRLLSLLERKNVGGGVIKNLRHALIEDGMRLGDAFQRFGMLDHAARQIILVAEDQGNLPRAFKEQAPFYHARYERKKMIIFGLVEVVVLMFLAFFILRPFISNIMLAYQAPSLFAFFSTVMLVPIIKGLCFIGCCIGAAVLWLNTPVEFDARESFRAVWLRIPIVSSSARLNCTAIFCRYFALSLSSGLNVFDALQLAVDAAGDPRLYDGIDDALAILDEGGTLETALECFDALPAEVFEYISLGEETGRVSPLLEQCADTYAERAELSIKRTISAIIYISRMGLIIVGVGYALLGNTSTFSANFTNMM